MAKKGITSRIMEKGTVFIIDEKTGEAVSFGEAEIKAKRSKLNSDFFMFFNNITNYNSKICIEIDLLFYLLRKMSSGNVIAVKNEKIAKDLGVCRQTIETAKKKMQKANWLDYTAGVIFINPEKIYRGNAYKREQRINEYYAFGRNKNEEI